MTDTTMERQTYRTIIGAHIEEIRQWRSEGCSLKSIAKELSVDPSVLSTVLRSDYADLFPPKSPTLHGLVRERVDEIREMRNDETPWAEIAEKLSLPCNGEQLKDMYYSVMVYVRSKQKNRAIDPANVPFITHQKYR